jgi:hypothetical protein
MAPVKDKASSFLHFSLVSMERIKALQALYIIEYLYDKQQYNSHSFKFFPKIRP